jgi:hypothetical protein
MVVVAKSDRLEVGNFAMRSSSNFAWLSALPVRSFYPGCRHAPPVLCWTTARADLP